MALKTFDDCVKECLRYGMNDSVQVNKERIERWINEAQLMIARNVDAPEFQANEEKTLTVGTFEYALPTEFLRMASIAYPKVSVRLKPVDLQTFDSLQSGGTVGTGTGIEGPPVAYTIYNKKLWLFPIPTVADKLEFRYYKRPPLLSGVEVPVLGEDYLMLLVDYALWRAYRAEDDMELAQVHEQQYEKDLAKYKVDVMWEQDDRPKQLQGTWGSPL